MRQKISEYTHVLWAEKQLKLSIISQIQIKLGLFLKSWERLNYVDYCENVNIKIM